MELSEQKKSDGPPRERPGGCLEPCGGCRQGSSCGAAAWVSARGDSVTAAPRTLGRFTIVVPSLDHWELQVLPELSAAVKAAGHALRYSPPLEWAYYY